MDKTVQSNRIEEIGPKATLRLVAMGVVVV